MSFGFLVGTDYLQEKIVNNPWGWTPVNANGISVMSIAFISPKGA
jgi:hypothetical protein